MDEDGLSDAIRNFIMREQQDEQVQPQPQQQQQQQPPQPPPQPEPEPEPEPVPEPTPSPQSTLTRKPKKKQEFIRFVYNGDEFAVNEDDALPSIVANYFGLNVKDIKVNRGEKQHNVDIEEDDFDPPVKIGKKYTITKMKPAKATAPTPIPRHPKAENECAIVINDQRKSIPSGTVKKTKIIELFSLGAHSDIRLIGYNGIVLPNGNQYYLNPGTVYYARLGEQKPFKKEVKEVEADSIDTFSKPLAFMPPFMAALVRIAHILSVAGDSVTFPESQEKNQKLHCSNKLSTCAYQIAYRFNNALEAIIKFSEKQMDFRNSILNFMPNNPQYEVVPDEKQQFEDGYQTKIFFDTVSNIVQLSEKAHDELEELLKKVIAKMKAENPSIASVKAALKVETNQEKRSSEMERAKEEDTTNLSKICQSLVASDDEILPKRGDLYAISINRESINHANELVERVLSEITDKDVLEDIVNLLDFGAKISHCNLMRWAFTLNLWKNVVEEVPTGEDIKSPSDDFTNRKHFAMVSCFAVNIWKIISRSESLLTDLNKNASNGVQEFWNKLKEEVINCQYALEICYEDEHIGNFVD